MSFALPKRIGLSYRFRRFQFLLMAVATCISIAAVAADPNPPSLYSDRGAWPICRQWTVAETHHYAAWIGHIFAVKTQGTYEQRTARIERVLTDPEINLLLTPEFAGEGCNEQLDLATMRAMHNVLDCAKLAVTLSSYYAYRRGLPWTFSYVRAGDGGDMRTADYTIPARVVSSLEYRSAGEFFRDAVTGTNTGNLRVEMHREFSERSDTLPVAISPRYLIPGSLYYLDGHVLILANVTPHGEVRFLDATVAPSRDIYAYNAFNVVSGIRGKRSDAQERAYDGCYHGFRIYRWPIAEVDEQGRVLHVRRRTDAEMQEFGVSPEQYDKIEVLMTGGKIIEDGYALDSFQKFIRLRMRSTNRINLAEDLNTFTDEMLALLLERERHVQRAWRDVAENGPVTFPEDRIGANVYTAGGRWGEQASAMADVGLRAKYFELMDHLNFAIAWFDTRPEDVNLDGFYQPAIWGHADLADAVLRAKKRLFAEKTFTYTDSAGKPVRLSLLDIEARLYDLSFDPNHPPELRWGAIPAEPELASLPGKNTPIPDGSEVPMMEAYHNAAYYRSQSYWEPERSSLREIFTHGFPVRDKLDANLRQKWFDGSSPPLVPRESDAVWRRK